MRRLPGLVGRVGGGALLVIVAACSAATRGAGSARCVPEAIDSAWVVAGPVYRNCEVDGEARRENPDLRLDYLPSQACETALLEFVVDGQGRIELGTARLVRGNSPALARALMSSLPLFRYRAAVKQGVPVRQVVQEGAAVLMTREQFGPPRQPRVNVQNSCVP